VAPILNNGISNCGRVQEDKVNSFLGFRSEDEIKFCSEEENIIEKKRDNINNFHGLREGYKEKQTNYKLVDYPNEKNITNNDDNYICDAATIKECIIEAFRYLDAREGRKARTIDEIDNWMRKHWRRTYRGDIGVDMADMVRPGILRRVGRGLYELVYDD
jgi:hypothetical protein